MTSTSVRPGTLGLGKRASETIAIEDSKSSALSTVRAGIPVIAYVSSYNGEDTQKAIAKALTNIGAKSVKYHWSEFKKYMKEIENDISADIQSTL